MYRHIRHTLPDAKYSVITQTCDRTMAELNASHPCGQLIAADNPSHVFAVSDLVTQDNSITVTSTVSASTNHDFDTQPSKKNGTRSLALGTAQVKVGRPGGASPHLRAPLV